MQPNARFQQQSKAFWADVRTISQKEGCGYTRDGAINVPTLTEIVHAYTRLGLDWQHIASRAGLGVVATPHGQLVIDYLQYRADTLADAPALLMDATEARTAFNALRNTQPAWRCPMPMNRQAGVMRQHAYLTCMVNMVIESNVGNAPIAYDPQQLTAVTRNSRPLRTMSRRVDGAFPGVINPTGIWEIKEYYYTTTFGSRIADGVYETLLDGMEIEEMSRAEGYEIEHLLIVDARHTWWSSGGRPYLCRMVDMMHMGYVDEVLLGREVLTRLPILAHGWATRYAASNPGVAIPAEPVMP